MASFYSQFAPYYEEVFPFREEVYAFLAGYAGTKGSRLLDAGCGPGHYCGRFCLDGFIAEGIDLDEKMIEAAKSRYPNASFRSVDIAEPGAFHGPFRLIYCIGNVLSHLPASMLTPFARRVHASLENGGYWIFQVVNWDYLLMLREYSFPEKNVGGGSITFCRDYPVISDEFAVFDVRLVSGGETVFQDSSILYPSTSESYCMQHENAGFILDSVYAGFDKSFFRKEKNSGLVMVFRKP